MKEMRKPQMPILPPNPKAVIPEYRRLSPPLVLKKWLQVLFVGLAVIMFFATQLALGFFSVNGPTDLLMAIIALGLVALIVFAGNDVRWRLLVFVCSIMLMMGQMGRVFGTSMLTSTFVVEFMLSVGFTIWVLFDVLGGKHKLYPPRALVGGLTLYAIAITICVLVQPKITSDNVTRAWITQVYFGIALATGGFLYLDRLEKIGYAMRMLLFGVTFFSLVGIVEWLIPGTYYDLYLRIFPTNKHFVDQALVEHRVFASFNSGPGFGVWLAMFVPLALYPVIFARTAARKFWSLVMLGIIMLALFFTAARGPFAAALAAVGLMTVFTGNRRIAAWTFSVLLFGLLMFGWIGPQLAKVLPGDNMFARVLTPKEGALGTLEERNKVWREGVEIFREHRWFGIGPGEWGLQRRMSIKVRESRELRSSHSGYIGHVVETGVAGLTALLIMIGAIVLTGYRAVHLAPPGIQKGFAAALFASLISLFIMGLTEPSFALHRMFYWMCLAAGMLARVPYLREAQAAAEYPSRLSGPRHQSVPALPTTESSTAA